MIEAGSWGLTMKAASIHIGTSGWHYDHWRRGFYPVDLASSAFLSFYAGRFGTVEINNSFYQLPRPDTFVLWRETVPAGFLFSVKASRYITHMKKLKDPGQPLQALLDRVVLLEHKLGPILFQLPPRWGFNPERLLSFLRSLPGGFRYAFEFRDTSWFDPRVYDALTEHRAAFCIYELAGSLSPRKVTADFVYLRLHGPGAAYRGQYDTAVLSQWADFFTLWYGQRKEIFCYFDNDESAYAAMDAMKLQEMVEARIR